MPSFVVHGAKSANQKNAALVTAADVAAARAGQRHLAGTGTRDVSAEVIQLVELLDEHAERLALRLGNEAELDVEARCLELSKQLVLGLSFELEVGGPADLRAQR